jgi:hypothetical protein
MKCHAGATSREALLDPGTPGQEQTPAYGVDSSKDFFTFFRQLRQVIEGTAKFMSFTKLQN